MLEVMEFMTELKSDNTLLRPHIDAATDKAFHALIQSHEHFEQDKAALLDYLHNPGRGIGGSLVMRMAQLSETKEPSQDTLAIAVATEIMNAGILIIDDVVDNSPFRKSQPTVHKVYEQSGATEAMSKTKAIQLGVLCMQLASVVSSQVMSPQARRAQHNLQRGALRVTAGQLLEAHVSDSQQLQTQSSIQTVHSYKTGYYSFEAPMQSGLLLADASQAAHMFFSNVAQKLGLGFQLQDDVNNLFADSEAMGKPTGDDVRLGLYTMITHVASERLKPPDRVRFNALRAKSDITEDELVEYQALLHAYDVDKAVGSMAINSIRSAMLNLEYGWKDHWNPDVREYLDSLTRFLVQKSGCA